MRCDGKCMVLVICCNKFFLHMAVSGKPVKEIPQRDGVCIVCTSTVQGYTCRYYLNA